MKRLALLAVISLANAAYAADITFRDVAWPRHDKNTGLLEWELRAVTARPNGDNEYACSNLEFRTYKLGQNNKLRNDSFVRADHGTYSNAEGDSTIKLSGGVVAEFYGNDPARVLTESADVHTMTDATRQEKMRQVTSSEKVSMVTKGRVATGVGMIAEERTGASNDSPKRSSLKLLKNVVVTSEGSSGGTLPGMATGNESKAQKTVITCDGPASFDRDQNTSVFENNVLLNRGGATLNCTNLFTKFDQVVEGGLAQSTLTKLVGRGKVVLRSATQTFTGDVFDWDPATTTGKLTGAPATMTTPAIKATANNIFFDQRTDRMIMTGDAVAEIELHQ